MVNRRRRRKVRGRKGEKDEAGEWRQDMRVGETKGGRGKECKERRGRGKRGRARGRGEQGKERGRN